MKRWQRIGEDGAPSERGHLVDTMAPPVVVSRPEYSDIEVTRIATGTDPAIPAVDPERVCTACGRPLIGGVPQ